MKKLFRKLFSPTAFTIFILLAEVLGVAAFFIITDYVLEDQVANKWAQIWYIIYRVAALIIELAVYFHIVRKNDNPEFKIPWITGLILLPVLTAILYVIFANHGLRPKEKKIIPKTNKIVKDIFALDEYQRNIFKNDVPLQYQGVFNYLRNVTFLAASKDNKVTYFKNGETFFPQFIEDLKKAKKFIFMEFFIIGEGKEWSQIEQVLLEKVKEGVEVRLIYDDMGSFGTMPMFYDRKMRKKGMHCYRYNKFYPVVSGFYNNRDHRKIAVIDHKIGYTGGMNLADEYANEEVRFGYWKDTMVKIEGPCIANLIATFLSNYDLNQGQISDYDKYIKGDYPIFENENGYAFFFGDGPGAIDGNNAIGEQNYLNLINAAHKTLWISTPYLIPTFSLTEALKNAAKRGVDVKLFVPGIPDKKVVYWMAKGEFHDLVNAGVNVYTYTPGFNHEKQLVADDRLAFCGTINFDFRSLVHHFECGVTLMDTDCIKEMVEDFKEMEKVSYKVPKTYRLRGLARPIVVILKIFRSLL